MGETRREFFKNVLLGIGGVIAGQVIKANTQKVQATTQVFPVTSEQKTEVRVQSEPQTPVQIQTEPASQKEEEPKKEAKEISLLFPNTTPLEKSTAAEMIDKQIVYYKSQTGYEKRVSDTLFFKNMIAVAEQKLRSDTNPRLSELLLGMIFVESKGDPNAVPPKEKLPRNVKDKDIPKGLCQIKMSTVEDLGISVFSSDLFDPEKNISFGLLHLERLFRLFPDPSLAFWAYHLGEGNMVEAIEEYVVREKGANRRVVQLIFNFLGGGGSASLVKEYNLIH